MRSHFIACRVDREQRRWVVTAALLLQLPAATSAMAEATKAPRPLKDPVLIFSPHEPEKKPRLIMPTPPPAEVSQAPLLFAAPDQKDESTKAGEQGSSEASKQAESPAPEDPEEEDQLDAKDAMPETGAPRP